MIKKLTCHCGSVEAQVEVPETGFKKVMRCNCTLCKRKGYIIGVLGPDDFKIVKGENLLKLYQYHTKMHMNYYQEGYDCVHLLPKCSPKLFA